MNNCNCVCSRWGSKWSRSGGRWCPRCQMYILPANLHADNYCDCCNYLVRMFPRKDTRRVIKGLIVKVPKLDKRKVHRY